MKIVALNGLLGYGYAQQSWQQALAENPDVIGVDAGSVDPGPYYLGSGTSFTNHAAVKRDLALALPEAIRRHIPFIIGTAGGSGAEPHIKWLSAIVAEIAREHQLSFRYAVIYSDVSPDYVLGKMQQGQLEPLGHLEADSNKVIQAAHIVAQMSVDPFIKALDEGVDLIIAGRACDTAIYAAAPIRAGFDPGLAYHMAKIMECGSMCSDPVSASDVILGEIGPDSFTLTPMNPIRCCTIQRVAAHTLYEQANPYLIHEPDGTVDVSECCYEQIDARSVRVSGSRFIPAKRKTLKLEGACLAGYRAISLAGINDPETIRCIDALFDQVKAFISENQADIDPGTYTIHLKKYGGVLAETDASLAAQMAVIIDVVGDTQAIADSICAVARSRLLHADYPGRRSSAGNLAFPYSPSDLHLGPVYAFCLYHLAEVADFFENIKISWEVYENGQTV